MKPLFKLVIHDSAQAIMQAHNEGLAKRIKETEGIDVDPSEVQFDCGNNSFVLDNKVVIDHLTQAGFWAFADTWTNTIHVYFEPWINAKIRFQVLAHEFAHLIGKPHKNPLKEEQRCDAFAEQAQQLMVLWEQLNLLEKNK